MSLPIPALHMPSGVSPSPGGIDTWEGARPPGMHAELLAKANPVLDRCVAATSSTSPSPTALTLIDDIEQCHRLLQDALTGCQFADHGLTDKRADVLKQAATLARYDSNRDVVQLAALRTWRGEMGSLLNLAITEGQTGRQVSHALMAAPLSAPPANLVEAFREAEHLHLVLERPRRLLPGFTLRQEALAELKTIRPEDVDNPNALPDLQAAIAAAWRLRDQADRLDRDTPVQSRPPSPAQRVRFDTAGTSDA